VCKLRRCVNSLSSLQHFEDTAIISVNERCLVKMKCGEIPFAFRLPISFKYIQKISTSAVWPDCIVLCCSMQVQAEVHEFTCLTFIVYDRLHKQSPLDKILWRINPAEYSHHSSLIFVLISSLNDAWISVLEYSLYISRIKICMRFLSPRMLHAPLISCTLVWPLCKWRKLQIIKLLKIHFSSHYSQFLSVKSIYSLQYSV
jgi:hypothetical protein